MTTTIITLCMNDYNYIVIIKIITLSIKHKATIAHIANEQRTCKHEVHVFKHGDNSV